MIFEISSALWEALDANLDPAPVVAEEYGGIPESSSWSTENCQGFPMRSFQNKPDGLGPRKAPQKTHTDDEWGAKEVHEKVHRVRGLGGNPRASTGGDP